MHCGDCGRDVEALLMVGCGEGLALICRECAALPDGEDAGAVAIDDFEKDELHAKPLNPHLCSPDATQG